MLVCKNKSSVTSSPFLVTDCLGKVFRRINIADNVSGKVISEEQSPLIRRQVVWRNYSEQMTERQNSVETCTNPQRKKHLPYMEIAVASTEKVKVVHIKPV